MMLLILRYLLIFLPFMQAPTTLAMTSSELAHNQVYAEEGIIHAFLASLTKLYTSDNKAIFSKYPLGHPDKRHSSSWARRLPMKYIDNIFSVRQQNRLLVIIRFNNKPYTSPILQGKYVVLTAMHDNAALTFGKLSTDSLSLTSWQCLDKRKGFTFSSTALTKCHLKL